MEVSVSILSIKDNLQENIKKIDKCEIDYLHIDVMDGKFVSNKTCDISEVKEFTNNLNHKLDVHLMVNDVNKYIDDFKIIKPEYITFHCEIDDDINNLIDKIHSLNIKAGLAINPNTDISKIEPFLSKLDLVLVMSVYPGKGGQSFINEVTKKVDVLKQLQPKYNYVIEMDGGINDTTIKYCNSDIVVVGSFITRGIYDIQIDKLKSRL